ncbi:hypothetical protein P3X46_023136 [Hevea brasiliensis]|uniref:BZIP domain-containing protein n=1 Tax=Hevea brasiliensis TaxID=3981 RepID=A0ABQ9LBX1_HEVBR|nr:basic leucine zipper 43-like [Hevea brasiliensis]KAJ9163471.1 hypothetical protein P3X46_023136 [Hevea brasiliensis]
MKSTGHPLNIANFSRNQEANSSLFNRSFSSNSPIHFPIHMLSPHTSALNADSTLNETGDQLGISHARRLKRMISNRESARRSRMRKKKQIEELQYQVNHLQTMNHQLSEKVISLLESNHQILQENYQLKERVSSFQIVLSDLLTPIRNVEDSICNTNCLRGETSN